MGGSRSIPDTPFIIWIKPLHNTSVGDVQYDSLQGEDFSEFTILYYKKVRIGRYVSFIAIFSTKSDVNVITGPTVPTGDVTRQ